MKIEQLKDRRPIRAGETFRYDGDLYVRVDGTGLGRGLSHMVRLSDGTRRTVGNRAVAHFQRAEGIFMEVGR